MTPRFARISGKWLCVITATVKSAQTQYVIIKKNGENVWREQPLWVEYEFEGMGKFRWLALAGCVARYLRRRVSGERDFSPTFSEPSVEEMKGPV